MREPCLCASPDCLSCGPAQGWHVHSRHCADEDGRYDCGQVAYGDEEPGCVGCGAPSASEYCGTCWRRIEEEESV
jgi:hypothetical protein